MKRSQINAAHRAALACFERTGWTLPPEPRWDITDFTLGDFDHAGLVVVNLAEEPEYCEKLMHARRGQKTPLHTHRRKKEDIICRWGRLAVELRRQPAGAHSAGAAFTVSINGRARFVQEGETVVLLAGERITLVPGVYHAFWPDSDECVIGEVSTANDDLHDNIFVDPRIGRFPAIEEDEPAAVHLVSEQ